MRIVWLERTHDDFQNTIEYYSENAETYIAYQIIQRIVDSAEKLIDFPYMGHICPDDDEILQWHIPDTNYTIPYRIKGKEIQVLRVFHQLQDKPYTWNA